MKSAVCWLWHHCHIAYWGTIVTHWPHMNHFFYSVLLITNTNALLVLWVWSIQTDSSMWFTIFISYSMSLLIIQMFLVTTLHYVQAY